MGRFVFLPGTGACPDCERLLPLLGNIIHRGGRPSVRYRGNGGGGAVHTLRPDSLQSLYWKQSMNAKQLHIDSLRDADTYQASPL